MFEQTFVDSQARTRKPWTVGASLAIQCVVVIAILIAPLMHIAALEMPRRDLPLLVTLKPLAPEPVRAENTAPLHATPRVFRNPLAAPARVPARIDMTPDAPALPAIGTAGITGLASATGFSGASTELPAFIPPHPAPRPSPPQAQRAPLRVSGGVQEANLIYAPKPIYPALARTARVQGTVRLQAIIAVDGSIRNLQAVSGPPLLVNAAMDAVRRWQYKPTLLNGSAVEVITEIDVNFTMN